MHLNLEKRNVVRGKRGMRVRSKLRGTAERPRLSVFRSLKHIAVQVIDDEQGVTLASFSTLSKEYQGKGRSKEAASTVGARIAELALGKGIVQVVLDRGRLKYHGLVAVLADAARAKGMKF